MKLFFSCLICSIVAASCSKSGSGSGNNNQTLYLDSVKVYTIGQNGNSYIITNFTYDASFRLLSAIETGNDTTSGTPTPVNSTISFSYNGTDTIPSAYTNNVHHALTYDGQGRLLVDSQDIGSPGFLEHYSYGTGYIARSMAAFVDTIFTDGKDKTGYIAYQGSTLTLHEGYYYSIYTNPFYFGRLANHIGYLFQPSFFDMASREICAERQYILNAGDPNTNINYTWVTNSSSQVVSGVGLNASTNKAVEYYTFTYRK